MPCGPKLIETVARLLDAEKGLHTPTILVHVPGNVSRRAIRYAINELVKQGRAVRKGGRQGAVYAVKVDG